MLIAGAGGFAKELLTLLKSLNYSEKIAFFDNINLDKHLMFGKYPVLNFEEEVINFFLASSKFTLGTGRPEVRRKFFEALSKLGGKATTVISKHAFVGDEDVFIGEGTTIMHGATISNSSNVGRGCLMYFNSVVAHDCNIGDFVEISPGATILGSCKVGNNVSIGANATILPGVSIFDDIVVGAGAVVTKSFDAKCVIAGVPARIISRYE